MQALSPLNTHLFGANQGNQAEIAAATSAPTTINDRHSARASPSPPSDVPPTRDNQAAQLPAFVRSAKAATQPRASHPRQHCVTRVYPGALRGSTGKRGPHPHVKAAIISQHRSDAAFVLTSSSSCGQPVSALAGLR